MGPSGVKPTTRRRNVLAPYLAAHAASALATMLAALLVDTCLRAIEIPIHPWKDAFLTGVAAFTFSSLLVPLLWRMGLRTLPQYMLGAVAIFAPATLLSLAIIAVFDADSILIKFTDIEGEEEDSYYWALTAYIRIARSAVLLPVYVTIFCAVYHKHFGMRAWTRATRAEN
ncbi:MAG: hypothetical protein MRY74_05395 [Neomegalonema sp.]|nr:hypothetical protein [Neomegalonema sp.]